MKTTLLHLAVLTTLLAAAPRARAEISIEVFYDRLEPYGDWIDVANYGYCWQPRDVAHDWRPYTIGEWAYTDAGWTWISDEPFGWATYHYGRWTRLAQRGWVWIPDTQWGPAWVSWRHSDHYIGWAPLPPETRVIVDVALGAWVDSYFDVGPTAYCFVETRHFGAPRLADVLIAPRENVTIIRQTRNVTNVQVVNNMVINNGPDYGTLARAADRPIRKLRLEREDVAPAAVTSATSKARIEGDTLKVAAPHVTAQSTMKPRHVAQKVTTAEVDRGWKDAGPAAEIQPLREQLKAEAKAPDGLPQQAKPKPLEPKRPLPPVAERPLTRPSPTPSHHRIETRPPTPEPLRYREPQPDGVDRAKPAPPATQSPEKPETMVPRPHQDPLGAQREPKREEPRLKVPPIDDDARRVPLNPQAMPERPLPSEPRARQPEVERPAKPEAPGKVRGKSKDSKPDREER